MPLQHQIGTSPALKRTPLHDLHAELGARFTAFAGYEMPIHFRSGILREHLHSRAAAGLFDVSHMGQIAIYPRDGDMEKAARAIEGVAPVDAVGLIEGRQRYSLLTNSAAGILDDLMVAHRGDHFAIVVNASRKETDEAHLRALISADCRIERLEDRALLALQGPLAESAFMRLAPAAEAMRFMDVRSLTILGVQCEVSRSGYTGEDGFEISVPAARAQTLAQALLEDSAVAPIGLGARDTLRLEAGLCLYGSDLDPSITPVEASLEWTIAKARRAGGARAAGFPGAEVVLAQLACGSERRRVGLRPADRIPVRAGAELFADERGRSPLGQVTSGGFGPTMNAPIAMGYVTASVARPGAVLFADVRGRRLPVKVSELPFVALRYKRDAQSERSNVEIHQRS
jgi:aminomethyltransferase